MGEYGMSYADARRVPTAELHGLWAASERRMARKELQLLEDLFAVAGLQSEVRVEGERPRKGKRVTPVTFNERKAELLARGYPTVRRSTYDPAKDRERILGAFQAGGLDDSMVVSVVQVAPAPE